MGDFYVTSFYNVEKKLFKEKNGKMFFYVPSSG